MDEFDKLLDIQVMRRKYSSFYESVSIEEILSELLSEIDELKVSIRDRDKNRICEELGDLFLDLTLLALKLEDVFGIKLKNSLKCAYNKVITRSPHILQGKKIPLDEERKIWMKK